MTDFRIRPVVAAIVAASILTAGFSAAADTPPHEARYVKSEAVNVRGGPGTSNTIIEVLLLGTEVQIYASVGNWNRISPPGQQEKWIYAPLLQKEKPSAKPVSKKKDDQPARASAPTPPQEKAPQKGKSEPDQKPNWPDQRAEQPDQGKDSPAPRR